MSELEKKKKKGLLIKKFKAKKARQNSSLSGDSQPPPVPSSEADVENALEEEEETCLDSQFELEERVRVEREEFRQEMEAERAKLVEGEAAKWRAELEDFKAQVKEVKEENEGLKEQSRTLTQDLSESKRSYKAFQQDIQAKDGLIACLVVEVEAFKKNETDFKDLKETKESALELKRQVLELRGAEEIQQGKIRELEKLTQQRGAALEEKDRLVLARETLTQQLKLEVKGELGELEEKNGVLLVKVGRLEEEVGKGRREQEALQNELQLQRERLEEEVGKGRREQEALQNELQRLEERVKGQLKLQALESQHKDMRMLQADNKAALLKAQRERPAGIQKMVSLYVRALLPPSLPPSQTGICRVSKTTFTGEE